MKDDPYDLPEGEHEQMTFGGLMLFRHDYDGPWVVVVDHGAGMKKGYYPGAHVHAEKIEKAIRKLVKLKRGDYE